MSLKIIDFETYYDRETYSLSKMTTEEYIRDPRFQVIGFSLIDGNGPVEWVTGDDAYIEQRLRAIDWDNTVQAAHNNRFDGGILGLHYGLHPKFMLDTMSMAMGLIGLKTRVSLEKLAEFFELPIRKGHEVHNMSGLRREDIAPHQMAAYGEYAKTDALICRELLRIMMPKTSREELQLQDWTMRAFTNPQIVLDRHLLEQELIAYRQRRDTLLERVGVADVSVLRSDATFAELLLRLGVQPPMKDSPKQKNPDGTPKRVYAFSKQDLAFMDLLEDDDPDVATLVEARLGTKSSMLEGRLLRLIAISKRGPMPVPLNYCGATPTRRWSGDDAINIQNFPRNTYSKTEVNEFGKPLMVPSPLRAALTAPRGKKMAAADLSQIELRVNAWQTGQTDVLAILANGGDVYCDQATSLAGKLITKADPVWRFIGKTTELQCGYQCGWAKFQHSLMSAAKREGFTLDDTSDAFCAQVVNGYRTKRDKISGFWRIAHNALQALAFGQTAKLGPYLIRDHAIELPNGLKMYYPNLRQRAKEGEGEIGFEWVYDRIKKGRWTTEKMYGGKLVENITQHVARLFVSDALLRLDTVRYPDGRRVFDIVFTVHDEIVVVYDENLPDEWVIETLTWALTTRSAWAPDMPLACEVSIGRNYSEAK